MTTSKSTNYLDRFDADTLPDLDDCIIVSGDHVRFTAKGRNRYGERFGKAGIDIRTIRTKSQLKHALENSFHVEIEMFVDHLEDSGGDTLEKAYLAAIALGDSDEVDRLSKLIDRRNQAGLKAV